MSTALEATALGKRYGKQWALQNCSLSLPTGRIAGLVGPNGAGKTTLLHLAVGLLDGMPADRMPRIGFVAQETPLYRDFHAADLIRMGSKLNQSWDSAFATDRLTQLRIPLDRAVGKLSGGQRAQVALALALAKKPDLLLLDEPVASLDPLARREFLQTLMGSVAENGTTVLLSSHLVADLERVCDYVIVLNESRVQVLGAVDDLLSEHKVLIGPRRPGGAVAGVGTVMRESHTDRQSTLLVRTDGPVLDPAWTEHELSLEDLVLAYLAEPTAGALPGPTQLGMEMTS
jgi:ABC-2 type transport system ATP-binding protein